jgi:NitT/TauT family transport system ATP-binding protein
VGGGTTDIAAKICVQGVSLRYRGSAGPGAANALALNNISLCVVPGEFVAIIGPSGCGKSTLLKVISGLIRASSGSVAIDGKAIDGVPKSIGYLFQSDALLPWRTARQNVAVSAVLAGKSERAAYEQAGGLLADLGLSAALDKYPSELSGGMRKRVALARTLAYDPNVFLLDEPFSALDAQTRIHVGNRFLRTLEKLKQSVVFVTHDIEEAIALADRVIVMTKAPGRIAAEFAINLPRPRDYYASRFAGDFRVYQEQIWDVLRREMEGAL